jgi:hypothetical protein
VELSSVVHKTDFHIKLDYDESGLIVIVTHKPAGIERHARPGKGESVQRVRDNLLKEVQDQVYDPDEFEFGIGRCVKEGKTRTFYSANHKPTGKSRSSLGEVTWREMLDELVQELWNEGIYPK